MGNTTFSSITVQWINLTSILRRQVRNYLITVNITSGSSLPPKVTHGSQLTTEITGLLPSENYTVEVFGIDDIGNTYKTLAVNTRTKNSKIIDISTLFHCLIGLFFIAFISYNTILEKYVIILLFK